MAINLENLEASANALVAAAMKAGANECDVVVANGNSLSMSVRDGVIENSNSAEGDEFSLRVFIGKQVASVSTNQIEDIDLLAERAVSMAKVSPEDPNQGLADTELLATKYPKLDMLDDHKPMTEELVNQALEAESAGLAVSGVTKSMGASAGWGTSGFVLATSQGFSGNFSRSGFSFSAVMMGGEGEKMERDYDYSSAVFISDLRSPTDVGKKAGERAASKLNPRKIESGNMPVILDSRIASSIVGTILNAINASSVARKTSFWRDKMGEQVANKEITLIDDPLLAKGLGSKPFDGEGLACERLTPIKDGVLQNWLLDSATARELGMVSNGRASRSGSGTSPSSTNTWIASGNKSIEEFAQEIGEGLYVCETIGHGVNMVTGDYSVGAGGFWIENGEITYPVAEITIASNLMDMYMGMIPGNDLEFVSSTNSPSLLVNNMTIGGK